MRLKSNVIQDGLLPSLQMLRTLYRNAGFGHTISTPCEVIYLRKHSEANSLVLYRVFTPDATAEGYSKMWMRDPVGEFVIYESIESEPETLDDSGTVSQNTERIELICV